MLACGGAGPGPARGRLQPCRRDHAERARPRAGLSVRVLFVSSGELGGAELALETHLAHLPDTVEGHGLLLAGGQTAEAMAQRLGRPVAVAGIDDRPTLRRAATFARDLL